jgi:hypothetical protein
LEMAANCAATVRLTTALAGVPERSCEPMAKLLIVDDEMNTRLSLGTVFQKHQVQTGASSRGLETLPQNAMRDCIFNSILGYGGTVTCYDGWGVAGPRLPVSRGNRYSQKSSDSCSGRYYVGTDGFASDEICSASCLPARALVCAGLRMRRRDGLL